MYGYVAPKRPDELMHYGVIGMKWGVRRYQPYTKKLASGKYGTEVGLAAKRRTGKKLEKAVDRNEKEYAKAEAYTAKQKYKAQGAVEKYGPTDPRAKRAVSKHQSTAADLAKLRTGMARQEDYLANKHNSVRLTTKEQLKWDKQKADKARAAQVENSILLGDEKVRDLTKRMNQEDQLRNYQTNATPKKRGKQFVQQQLERNGSAIIAALVSTLVIKKITGKGGKGN